MAFAAKSMKRKNVKGLALTPSQPTPAPVLSQPFLPVMRSKLEARDRGLKIAGSDFRLDLKESDIIVLKELGAGNGGTVTKVRHAVTNAIMARKVGYSASSGRLQR